MTLRHNDGASGSGQRVQAIQEGIAPGVLEQFDPAIHDHAVIRRLWRRSDEACQLSARAPNRLAKREHIDCRATALGRAKPSLPADVPRIRNNKRD
ncbi:MAG: hypothetical protein JO056_06895 [Alphaproteobacteria bacterium]|nr:hypothetical protein [Alphaproteobacteria bacterium]